MVKKFFKVIIFLLFILTGVFLWHRGKRQSPYLKWGELNCQKLGFNSWPGVLIIFNSGGWGDTAFEEAEDFAKVVRGIKTTINKLGRKTCVVSYGRTKNNFLGRIQGMKEILSSFRSQSERLAGQVKIFLENNPQGKVLMTGLSLGAHFVGETMEKIDPKAPVLAIKAGTPFRRYAQKSKNILELIHQNDFLAMGNHQALLGVALRGIIRWAGAKIKGQKLSLAKAVHVPGHRYDWKFPWVKDEIVSFLENNLRF